MTTEYKVYEPTRKAQDHDRWRKKVRHTIWLFAKNRHNTG